MDVVSYSLGAKANKRITELVGSSKLSIPSGTTDERPTLSDTDAAIRFNTDTGGLEEWSSGTWTNVSADISAVSLKGSDTADNIQNITDADNGDVWVASDTLDAYVYDGTDWLNLGPLKGDQGVQGISVVNIEITDSVDNVDTYTITYSNSSTSTFEVTNGIDGLSTYAIAVNNGFDGTEEEFISSLKGDNTYVLAVADGFDGTEEEWLASLKGDSAYAIAASDGYSGTEKEWLSSLKGEKGDTGLGIASVERTTGNAVAGETDTYTITYSDSTTSTFDLTNGEDGTTIDHLTRTTGDGVAGGTDTYTVWADVDETVDMGTFDVYNGADGDTIDHMTRTDGDGLAGETDTYVLYKDADENVSIGSFEVYNGQDGDGAINDDTETETELWSSLKIRAELDIKSVEIEQAKQSAVAMALIL